MLSKETLWTLITETSVWLSYVFLLQCTGWCLEKIHHEHCNKNFYNYFVASNSNTCRNIRQVATLCADKGSQITVPMMLSLFRNLRIASPIEFFHSGERSSSAQDCSGSE